MNNNNKRNGSVLAGETTPVFKGRISKLQGSIEITLQYIQHIQRSIFNQDRKDNNITITIIIIMNN